MYDARVAKLADLLIRYSLKVRKGQYVRIGGSALAAPLITECYRAAVKRGAHVETRIAIEGLTEIFYKEASEEQLKWVSPVERFRLRRLDASLYIGADFNTKSLTNCNPQRMAIAAKAQTPLDKLFFKRTAAGELKWCYTIWPSCANAQDAEMSLADYSEFVFDAGHLNDDDPIKTWRGIGKAQAALARALNRAREIRIVAPDTDLTFACKGRTWENCDGTMNFPDGEVFTGPIEDSVRGHIRFTFPAVHHGREVQDVFLEFQDGKVANAEAAKGEDYLHSMIAMDKGSCYVGETAFGVNYGIQRFTRNTLFDEKIGGTFHLALGASYPETGGKNESGLHWDMVCDLRKKSQVFADGKLIQKNGKFVDARFPQPGRKSLRTRK
jgi:aminopeptidase